MIGRVAGTTSYGGKDISLDELIDPYDTIKRDKLKNAEITKQTRWHECQCVFNQCRNSSTTDWDFSGPALRRNVEFNSKRLYEKKVDSLARTKSW